MALSDASRLLRYIAEKASAVELCGLFGDVEAAATQMWAVAQTNRRVTVPLYHFCLSWSHLENPSDEQAIAAAQTALAALGVDGHQALIGVHRDRDHTHVHVALNRVHPETGKALSLSHDYATLEKACRQIEADQGWAADRGRFDTETEETPDGIRIRLVAPSPETIAARRSRRAAGRGATARDTGRERRTGMPPLAEVLSGTAKDRIRAVLQKARSWNEVHAGLEPLGLSYVRVGSGARLVLRGADPGASLTPSQLGTAFGMAALRKRFGHWTAPEATEVRVSRTSPDPKSVQPRMGAMISRVTDEPVQQHVLKKSDLFKRSLLERTYGHIALSDPLMLAIRRVALDETPPRVELRSGAEVLDHGNRIATTMSDDYDRQAELMVAMALAKGWTACRPNGSIQFKRSLARAAMGTGLDVRGLPEDIATEIEALRAKGGAADNALRDPYPGGPTPEHANREARRQNSKARREAHRKQADILATRQADQQQTLNDLLDGKRGPLEQELRASLAERHRQDCADLRAARPPSPALPIIPLDADARAIRARRAAGERQDTGLDHTACPQHWLAAGGILPDTSVCGISARTLARFAAEVRIGPSGDLLYAHMTEFGHIRGFERPSRDRTAFVLRRGRDQVSSRSRGHDHGGHRGVHRLSAGCPETGGPLRQRRYPLRLHRRWSRRRSGGPSGASDQQPPGHPGLRRRSRRSRGGEGPPCALSRGGQLPGWDDARRPGRDTLGSFPSTVTGMNLPNRHPNDRADPQSCVRRGPGTQGWSNSSKAGIAMVDVHSLRANRWHPRDAAARFTGPE